MFPQHDFGKNICGKAHAILVHGGGEHLGRRRAVATPISPFVMSTATRE